MAPTRRQPASLVLPRQPPMAVVTGRHEPVNVVSRSADGKWVCFAEHEDGELNCCWMDASHIQMVDSLAMEENFGTALSMAETMRFTTVARVQSDIDMDAWHPSMLALHGSDLLQLTAVRSD
eukprot:3423354-Amphidinium_carterae.1